MSVLSQAKQHFSDISGELRSVEVPEWKTTIYYRPITIAQQGQITKSIAENKYDEAIVKKLIIMARDANGKRLFKNVDKFELLTKVDPKVVERICLEMEPEDLSVEDSEKNSEGTQT